jgi:hypothetical protein
MTQKCVGVEDDGTPVFECIRCHSNFIIGTSDDEDTELCGDCRARDTAEDLMLESALEKRRGL